MEPFPIPILTFFSHFLLLLYLFFPLPFPWCLSSALGITSSNPAVESGKYWNIILLHKHQNQQ